jgi:hypothetical protein
MKEAKEYARAEIDKMMKHTPEPWRRDMNSGLECDIRGPNSQKVALCFGLSNKGNLRGEEYKNECSANAARIVECVNACAGIENPAAIKDLIKAALAVQEYGYTFSDYDALKNALAALGIK